ncbi:MAG: hypothetical protein ACI3XI_09475, partial [Eubacteriales bacterium]
MRNFKSITALVLALFMLIPSLVACKPETGGDDTTSTPAEETTESPVSSLKITEGERALFTIVRPDPGNEDDQYYSLAKSIADDLKETTGFDFKHNTDFISWNTKRDPEAYELIIGKTNYDETAEVLSGLKYYDYAIVIRGHKIIIAAYTSSTLKKAITYFRNNMIPAIVKDEAGDYTIAFDDYIVRGKYAVEELTLDGNDIKDYTIVYGAGTPTGEKTAVAVADVIAAATGVYLPYTSDKEAEKPLEILVGKTNRAQSSGSQSIEHLHYKVSLQSGKLIIDCTGLASGDAAIRKLYADKLSGGGNVALTSGELCSGNSLDETDMPITEGSDIRIVTYNILKEAWIQGNYPDTASRAELFGGFLDVYKPDVVGVQEVCEKWVKYLPEYLGNYKLTGTKRDDGGVSYSAIVYDASKYNILAQGCKTYSKHASATCRNMSWAVFENKTDGTKFAFISTHWDYGNETEKQEMRRVQADEMTAMINSLKAQYG